MDDMNDPDCSADYLVGYPIVSYPVCPGISQFDEILVDGAFLFASGGGYGLGPALLHGALLLHPGESYYRDLGRLTHLSVCAGGHPCIHDLIALVRFAVECVEHRYLARFCVGFHTGILLTGQIVLYPVALNVGRAFLVHDYERTGCNACDGRDGYYRYYLGIERHLNLDGNRFDSINRALRKPSV